MHWAHRQRFNLADWPPGHIQTTSDNDRTTSCGFPQGLEDTFVILKTGATEALSKVPVHFETTFRCVKHYAIFSDYEEEISGVRTRDILRSISEQTTQTNPDFEIYNRLHTSGRDGLIDDDWNDVENGPYGKLGNPGWKLDKWKFVPMIDEALLIKPEAHWYVFIEADTYVIWRNMAQWLSRLDWNRPYYLGVPMQMNNEVFAYGGAGIVLSGAAMRLISQYRSANFAAVEHMTADDWAGDHVLGKILDDIGISLVWAWPMLSATSVWEFEHFIELYGRRPWCFPAVSYHHMSPHDIQDLWRFEQQWFRYKKDSVLLHKDIFKWHVYELTSSPRDEWDNLSSDEEPDGKNTNLSMTLKSCAQICSLTTECLQFSVSEKGCLVSKNVIGGVPRPGIQSGWMEMRVKALLENAGRCPKVRYVTS
ncbi:hypothetical protein BJY04DRAFT_209443 [Aspergillus karnatakaensis]|uniref:uncharacterized protein n=1 Tax=Aspergillus karnatakaensis TaxID=1810916 RepID=UPI003CCCA673